MVQRVGEKIKRICNVLFGFASIALLVTEIIMEATLNRTDPRGAILRRILLLVFCGICYIMYWVFCLVSETPRFLSNKLQAEGVYQYVYSLQQQPPIITMAVSCYHYRTEHHRRTDSNGKTTTSTSTRRVTTYSESREFRYQSFEDVSDMFLLAVDNKQARKSKPCLRLYMKKSWIFTDEQTLYAYRLAQDQIRADNRYRDQYMDYHEQMNIPGFKDYILCHVGDSKPKFYGLPWYFLACLFMLSVPYSIYVDSLSYEMDFTVKKRVSVLPKIHVQDGFTPVSYYQEAPVEFQNPNYNPNMPQQTQAPQQPYQQQQYPPQQQYQQNGPDQQEPYLYQQHQTVPQSNHPYMKSGGYQQM